MAALIRPPCASRPRARRLAACALLTATALAASACPRSEPDPRLSSAAQRLLALSDRASADLSLEIPSSRSVAPTLRALLDQASGLESAAPARDRAAALAALLFERHGVAREIDDPGPAFMLLPTVLRQRRGSCVGLVSLFLLLAERAGLPAAATLAPGHLFVRVQAPDEVLNVELLRRGELMPTAWYVERYGVPADHGHYLRPLSQDELVGVLRFNLGNAFREQARQAPAIESYRAALTLFPELVEARASLGLVFHQLKDFARAEQSYLGAAAQLPSLPGLRENLAALYLDMGTSDNTAAAGGSASRPASDSTRDLASWGLRAPTP